MYFFTVFKNMTASLPSIKRWSYVRLIYIIYTGQLHF